MVKGRKEAIINGDNTFQKALDDALNYQSIETHPERISKIKPRLEKNLNKMVTQLLLMYYLYHTMQKQ